jgi:hypothetical protein
VIYTKYHFNGVECEKKQMAIPERIRGAFGLWLPEHLEPLTKEELDAVHVTLVRKLEIVNDFHDYLMFSERHPEELRKRQEWRRARGECVEPDPLR